jgi:hypothetical protein
MACDFFHVDTVLLRRLYVLVFIHHDTRLVRIAGVTATPISDWVTQQARNLSMGLAEQASAIKFLIRDRDTKYTASFDAVFAADAISVIRGPVQAPPLRTLTRNGSWGPSAGSAWTGPSSSGADTWSPFWLSTWSTTTPIVRSVPLSSWRQHAPPTWPKKASRLPVGPDGPVASAVLCTSTTDRPPEPANADPETPTIKQ